MSNARLRIRLTAAAEVAVRSGHPWVYSDKVREMNRPGRVGEVAVVYDRNDRFLALGLYDPESPLAVRILHRGQPVLLDAAFWRERLEASIRRRAGCFDARTNGWRVVNGESDGFPGLVLDRYGDCCVLKIYTPVWLGSLGRRDGAGSMGIPAVPGLDLPALVREVLRPGRLVLRLSRNTESAATAEGWADGCDLLGPAGEPSVVFLEDDLRFHADVVVGQKTGFYLDQRGNRREVGLISQGASVLNVFSFSGGFSVHAARGGAREVTDVDISPHALASARANMVLNTAIPGVARARHVQVQADAFEWLSGAPRGRWDVVILDPPSFARREHERAAAIEAYRRLVRLGTECVAPGGWLLAASCSAHVSPDEFLGAVRSGLGASGWGWDEVKVTGHEPDHPADFVEARYLKALYARRSR